MINVDLPGHGRSPTPQLGATISELAGKIATLIRNSAGSAAPVTDPSAFKSGRDLASWIGLVPKQNSTGGKEPLGGISKQGDRYLRRLLVAGATAVVQHARRQPEKYPWITKLLARKPAKVVAIAVANKTARIAWVIMTRGRTNRPPTLAAAA